VLGDRKEKDFLNRTNEKSHVEFLGESEKIISKFLTAKMQQYSDKSEEFYKFLGIWLLFWCVLLHMKEGSRHVESILRLNFWHGCFSSYLVLHAFWKPRVIPEEIIITCSLAYFIVDLANMFCNDIIFKVGGYQKKIGRILEYFHHILSIIATFACATSFDVVCDLNSEYMKFEGPQNPLIRFALADVSTPFLVMWRKSDQKSLFWYTLFAILFIVVRIGYHGFFFIPRMYHGCNSYVKLGVSMYQILQLCLLIFVVGKWKSMVFKSKPNAAAQESQAEASSSPVSSTQKSHKGD
jgi:hypothetical protein